jgi:peptidoglycan glycosyltransferase
VPRGALLDRDGQPLSINQGEPGAYTRAYLYPDFSPTLGYSHPIYGQSGLEASLDPILRGEEYQPALAYLMDEWLYGQTPAGLDVRLSLDAALQQQAADLLLGHTGAAVLLDSESGEILLLASSPTYDPHLLEDEEAWEALGSTGPSPLLNRAAQGAYPPGLALAPLLYTAARAQGLVPTEPGELSYPLNETTLDCRTTPIDPVSWAEVLAAGCPGPIARLGLALEAAGMASLFTDLGLYAEPPLRLDVYAPTTVAIDRPGVAALGRSELRLSPLQLALAASSLTNFGVIPGPHIALAVEQADGVWLDLPALAEARAVLNSPLSTATAQELAGPNLTRWEHSALSTDEEGAVYSWYLAGTLPGAAAERFTIVILLEEDAPTLARTIGSRLLLSALGDQ